MSKLYISISLLTNCSHNKSPGDPKDLHSSKDRLSLTRTQQLASWNCFILPQLESLTYEYRIQMRRCWSLSKNLSFNCVSTAERRCTYRQISRNSSISISTRLEIGRNYGSTSALLSKARSNNNTRYQHFHSIHSVS